MSADNWDDCPVCNEKGTVRIDGLWNYDLDKQGNIVNNEIRGRCTKCGTGFGKYKGQVLK